MRDKLESYFQAGEFQNILNANDELIPKIYKCKVYLKMRDDAQSLLLAEELYSQNVNNVEIVQLLSKALIHNHRTDESITILKRFMENNKSEGVLRVLIEELVDCKRFEEAALYNDLRDVSVNTIEKSICVAIQCFNKPALLKNTLESLLSCYKKEMVSVVILQDHYIESNYKKNYEQGFNETREIVKSFLPKLYDEFDNVSLLKNEKNRGTAASCRALLDYCFKNHNAVMFIEDDFLLSKDALFWAKYLIKNKIGLGDYYFGSCESIFFDSKGIALESNMLENLSLLSKSPELNNKFVSEYFIPSTCFITTKEIWNKCSSIRGSIRGPESLNSWLNELGKKTILPVVPRGYDVGMMDDNGYSVAMLGKGNVKETKSTYLISEFSEDMRDPELFTGNKDLVYSATALLNRVSIEQLLKENV
jgi:hypothetical protein